MPDTHFVTLPKPTLAGAALALGLPTWKHPRWSWKSPYIKYGEDGRHSRRAMWIRYGSPYGQWTCRDGRLVLFNRKYTPIWQRCHKGLVTRADPTEWVPFVAQKWFYGDGTSPQHYPAKVDELLDVLVNFGVVMW